MNQNQNLQKLEKINLIPQNHTTSTKKLIMRLLPGNLKQKQVALIFPNTCAYTILEIYVGDYRLGR